MNVEIANHRAEARRLKNYLRQLPPVYMTDSCGRDSGSTYDATMMRLDLDHGYVDGRYHPLTRCERRFVTPTPSNPLKPVPTLSFVFGKTRVMAYFGHTWLYEGMKWGGVRFVFGSPVTERRQAVRDLHLFAAALGGNSPVSYYADKLRKYAVGENKADAPDIRKLANLVQRGRRKEAAKWAQSLDTFVREGIPDAVWEWLKADRPQPKPPATVMLQQTRTYYPAHLHLEEKGGYNPKKDYDPLKGYIPDLPAMLLMVPLDCMVAMCNDFSRWRTLVKGLVARYVGWAAVEGQ